MRTEKMSLTLEQARTMLNGVQHGLARLAEYLADCVAAEERIIRLEGLTESLFQEQRKLVAALTPQIPQIQESLSALPESPEGEVRSDQDAGKVLGPSPEKINSISDEQENPDESEKGAK